MTKGYGFCRFCNHPPPMILVTEYERKKLDEKGIPEHMGEVKIVQVYKCPKCGWMWMVSIEESTNK